MTFSTIILATTLIAQASDTSAWTDPRLSEADVSAMSELISYSPPPINKVVTLAPETPKNPKNPKNPETKKKPETIAWSDFHGKVVLIQSWTHTTPAGRQAFSTTQKILEKFDKTEDVVLVTIHTPIGNTMAQEYFSKTKTKTFALLDPTGFLCNALGFYKDPTNILVDKNGVVQFVGLRPSGVQKAIKELLQRPHDPQKITETYDPSNNNQTTKVTYPKHSTSFGRASDMQGKSAPEFFVQSWVTPKVNMVDCVRVVEFWATWCGPCIKSIPHINKLAKHFEGTVKFIGVSGETTQKVSNFKLKTPMKYNIAVDASKKMQKAISCSAIPLAMVISEDNIVRWQGNPKFLTQQTIQQILDASNGNSLPITRGKWDTSIIHE
jgi:cytochrome c biogenesis protein CcmG, thiol:disulfide interchange protein DsbE